MRRGRRSIATNLNTTLVQSEPHLNPDALKQTTGHCHPERSQLSGSEGRVGPVFTQILRKPATQMNPSPACLPLPKRLSDSIYSEIDNFQQVVPRAA